MQHKKTAVIVLGMHRSGTSALAGLLCHLGAAPPRNLMAANESNPLGYWESMEVMRLNDSFLDKAGSSWHDWRSIDRGYIDGVVGASFRADAARVVQEEYGDAELILLKDPRICRILPIWQDALTSLGYELRIAMILRAPLEVAFSLRSREGFSVHRGILLWLRHNLEAERASRALPRKLIAYASLLRDWRRAVEGMEQDFAIEWPAQWRSDAFDMAGRLDRNLRHHSLADRTAGMENSLHPLVIEAYSILESMVAALPYSEHIETLNRIHDAFNAACEIFEPLASELDTLAARRTQEMVASARDRKAFLAELERLSARYSRLKDETNRQMSPLDTVSII